METGIGATLREARNRLKLDLAEVEAAIKIRVRYLQAIENEQWDALPGRAYARGFIRTYAIFLGLDGDRLADDYSRGLVAGERVPRRIEPVPAASRRRESRIPGQLLVAAVCLLMAALVVGIGLASDGGDSSAPAPSSETQPRPVPEHAAAGFAAERPGVQMELTASAEVWVCLLDAEEAALVDGRIVAAGGEVGPFRSEGFELALGNGSATISIDGETVRTEPSASPVGYAIDSAGELTPLEEGERPDCQ